MSHYLNITEKDAFDASWSIIKELERIRLLNNPLLKEANEFIKSILIREMGIELFNNLIESKFYGFERHQDFGRVNFVYYHPEYNGVNNFDCDHSYFWFITFTDLDLTNILVNSVKVTSKEYELIEYYVTKFRAPLSEQDKQVQEILNNIIYKCRTKEKLERIFPEAVKYINWRNKSHLTKLNNN